MAYLDNCLSSYTHYSICAHNSETTMRRGTNCNRCALQGQPCVPATPICVTRNGRCPSCQLQYGGDNYNRNNCNDGGGGDRSTRSQHTWGSVLERNSRLGRVRGRPQYRVSGSAGRHPED